MEQKHQPSEGERIAELKQELRKHTARDVLAAHGRLTQFVSILRKQIGSERLEGVRLYHLLIGSSVREEVPTTEDDLEGPYSIEAFIRGGLQIPRELEADAVEGEDSAADL